MLVDKSLISTMRTPQVLVNYQKKVLPQSENDLLKTMVQNYNLRRSRTTKTVAGKTPVENAPENAKLMLITIKTSTPSAMKQKLTKKKKTIPQ